MSQSLYGHKKHWQAKGSNDPNRDDNILLAVRPTAELMSGMAQSLTHRSGKFVLKRIMRMFQRLGMKSDLCLSTHSRTQEHETEVCCSQGKMKIWNNISWSRLQSLAFGVALHPLNDYSTESQHKSVINQNDVAFQISSDQVSATNFSSSNDDSCHMKDKEVYFSVWSNEN